MDKDQTYTKWQQALSTLINWFVHTTDGVQRLPNPAVLKGLEEARAFLKDMQAAGIEPPPWLD